MVQNVGGLHKETAKLRLSGFHISCLRKICGIYWPQKITNKEGTAGHHHGNKVKKMEVRGLRISSGKTEVA